MKYISLFSIVSTVFFFFQSCKSSKPTQLPPLPDTITVVIKAINISENFTSQDEVIVLLHNELTDSVYHASLYTFNKGSQIYFDVPSKFLIQSTISLIEQDDYRSIQEVQTQFIPNFKLIQQVHKQQNYAELENLLGDNDIIGIKRIKNRPSDFNFSGIHKLDKYEYSIRFSYY